MKNLLKNWKTTVAGLASLLTGLGLIFSALGAAISAGHMPAWDQLTEGAAAVSAGVGLILAADHDKVPTVPPAAALIFVALALSLTACSAFKSSSISASWSGPTNSADVVVTTPSGAQIHATLDSSQACLASAALVAIPGTNLECASACGRVSSVSDDGKTGSLTLQCQVAGGVGGLFPLTFAIHLG